MNAPENSTRPRSRAEYVDVDTSPERVSRLWLKVSAELHKPKLSPPLWKRPQAYALASVLFLGIAGGVFSAQVVREKPTTAVAGLQHATLETANDSMAVDLQDGSRIELSAQTRIRLEEQTSNAVRIKLTRGKVECDVVPNRAREFLVNAPGVTVRVTGTRFSVDVTREGTASGTVEHQITVNVTRGSVEVEHIDGTVSVPAGKTWTMRSSNGVAATESIPSQGIQLAYPSVASEPVAPAASQPGIQPSTSAHAATPLAATSAAEPTTPAPTDAKSLLETGRVARREARPQAAAAAYRELLTRFPNDSRAGLAAFELGRLQADSLGQPAEAVQAFRQAVRLAPGSGFREDAMARLVDLYSRLDQQQSCTSAKQAYLRAFPSGVHAARIRTLCN